MPLSAAIIAGLPFSFCHYNLKTRKPQAPDSEKYQGKQELEANGKSFTDLHGGDVSNIIGDVRQGLPLHIPDIRPQAASEMDASYTRTELE